VTQLVLHIGLPKTGTTAFQRFIARNRSRLAESGLTYCDMFRGVNHVELAIAFTRITSISRAFGVHTPSDQEDLRRRLPELLAQTDRAPRWIASTELLSSRFETSADVARLADLLRPFFDEVTILLALRRADYWLPSKYVQEVKTGTSSAFDAEFVQRFRFLVDHRALIQRWADNFGADNIRLVPFLETDKADPMAVPVRLLEATGIPAAEVRSWPVPAIVQNVSLSAYGIELMRRMNERDDSPLKPMLWRKRVFALVNEQWPGPSPRITPEAAAELHANDWVRTGVGDGSPEWQAWTAQPDATPEPTPRAADKDYDRLIDALRRRELIDRTWFNLARARSRRLLRRIVRR
jgi:hypothetical protein